MKIFNVNDDVIIKETGKCGYVKEILIQDLLGDNDYSLAEKLERVKYLVAIDGEEKSLVFFASELEKNIQNQLKKGATVIIRENSKILPRFLIPFIGEKATVICKNPVNEYEYIVIFNNKLKISFPGFCLKDISPITKKKDSPETKAFWDDIEKNTREIESWPKWKQKAVVPDEPFTILDNFFEEFRINDLENEPEIPISNDEYKAFKKVYKRYCELTCDKNKLWDNEDIKEMLIRHNNKIKDICDTLNSLSIT